MFEDIRKTHLWSILHLIKQIRNGMFVCVAPGMDRHSPSALRLELNGV